MLEYRTRWPSTDRRRRRQSLLTLQPLSSSVRHVASDDEIEYFLTIHETERRACFVLMRTVKKLPTDSRSQRRTHARIADHLRMHQ